VQGSFDDILKAVTRGAPASHRVPVYEHFVDDEIIEQIMGYDFSAVKKNITTFSETAVADKDLDVYLDYWKKKLNFYRELGYGFLPVEFPPLFPQPYRISADDDSLYSRGKREWVNEKEGIIRSLTDLDDPRYWPDSDHIFDYRLFEAIARLLPDDMKIIGGFAGGPMEHAMYLLGMERFFLAVHDNRDLIERLFQKLRTIFVGIAERLARIDAVGIMRIGDDLGNNQSTFISPYLLRKYIFPIYTELVEISHRAGKPFILHSCGNLENVMSDLIDVCRFDAKHSFQDNIIPITEVKRKWGARIALLGGVDVDSLARSSPAEIKDQATRIIKVCSAGGGYAFGSGNTITNYIPVANYLAMLEAAREFNGDY